MSEMSNDIYWRLAAQCDGSIEQEKPTDSSKSAGTGALALSGDGNAMAAIPPMATHCSVLDLEHGSHLRQDSLIEPGSIQRVANVAPVCALSKSGAYLAVTFNDGFVSICNRSGERVWKASHKDWLKCQIIKIFFLADKTPSLICQNGLLYTLDHTSSAVSVSNFSKGHINSPMGCTFDPASRRLGLAGLATGDADSVCLTLWQLTEGDAPALMGQHGRPAKQGFFSKPKQSLQPWSVSLDTEAKACLVAVPGSQLHLFQWQDSPAKSLSIGHTSIAIPGGHCCAALWGPDCAAVLQPSGTLSAVRLSDPTQSCDVAQCSTSCLIRGLPARAPGQHPRLYVLDENPGNGSANLNSWRLSVLEMLQPEDELEELLASGDFGAASALAAKHKLPEDPIYKHQWRRSCSSGKPDLRMLYAVQDKAWVVQRCLQAVASDSASQTKLISLGLAETETLAMAEAKSEGSAANQDHQDCDATPEDDPPQVATTETAAADQHTEQSPCSGMTASSSQQSGKSVKSDSVDHTSSRSNSPAACKWRVNRLSLLRHLNRLQTHLDIHDGYYDAAAFTAFRNCSLAESAAAHAAEGEVACIEKLLLHHPVTVMPRLLEILDSLHDILPPREYLHLLPKDDADSQALPVLSAPEDWVESHETARALRATDEIGALVATERMALLSMGWHPPSARQIEEWRVRRAGSLRICSSQMEFAKSLLGSSSKGRSPELQSLRRAARSVSDLLRPGDQQQLGWDITLGAWAALDMPGRMQMLVDAQLPVPQLRRLLAQLLSHEQPQSRSALLCALLAQLAPRRFALCADLMRQEAQQCQVFPDASRLAQAACSAAYACGSDADWDEVQSLIAEVQHSLNVAMPAHPEAAAEQDNDWGDWDDAGDVSASSRTGIQDGNASDLNSASLAGQLSTVRRLASAAAELGALHIRSTLRELHVESREEAYQMLESCLALLEARNPALSEQRWTEAWRRLKVVREAAALDMTDADVLGALCGSLLRCRQWRLVRKYLGGTASTPLPASAAEALVLGRARKLLGSAATLGSPEVAEAQACLELLPDSAAAAAELAFIQGVERLQSYGISMSPTEVFKMQDRMDIIQLALDTHATAYRDAAQLAMLAEQLGLAERHSDIAMRQARAACKAGDLAAAHELALQLARQGHASAWILAAEVLESPGYANLVASREEHDHLSAFILAHCPAAQVGDYLRTWRQSDLTRMCSMPNTLWNILLQSVRLEMSAANQQCVPGIGNASTALACLLELEPLVAESPQSLLQDMPFSATRAFLLLRMTANALLALAGSDGQEDHAGGSSKIAQGNLHRTPWELLHAAEELDDEALSPAARAAQERCRQLSMQLGSASNERLLHGLLPRSAVSAFVAANSSSKVDQAQQMAALKQAVSAGIQEGDIGQAVAQLHQAAAVAARYQLSTWGLSMHFMEALLIMPMSLEGADEALKESRAEVLSNHDDALEALAVSAWPQMAASTHAQLQLFISLLTDISRDKGVPEESLQALQSAAHFVQRTSKVAPGLNSRLIAGPVIAAALRHISPEMSRRLFLALVPDAISAAEQTAHTKQPLKRALFPEDQPQADVEGELCLSKAAATWNVKAFDQISRHVSASNASQLASLVRSLPLMQALRSFQKGPEATAANNPLLRQSSVLLAHLMKALPAPASQAEASATPPVIPHQLVSHSQPLGKASADSRRPVDQEAAQHELRSASAGESLEADVEEAYKRCRKHLRQLEAGQLAALLRFWLLQGPSPVPNIDSSRPQLQGPLRLRVLQDGIAAITRLVDKAPGSPEQPSKVEVEDLSRLQHQLQQEADSQSFLARIQHNADLTAEQASIVLEAQKSGQPGERALSLPATLQRLVAASCSFQTVALIALELSSKAQQHRSEISPKAASDDASPPDSAADAATAKALQAASEAVAGVLVGALEAFSESRESAAGVHQAREQASDASVWAVQAVLSCLEGSADGRQPALPWSQDDFRSTLSTSRDEVWTKMADAMLAAAAAQSSSSSIDPVAYALLDAMASIAPIHSIPASTRWAGWHPKQPMPAQLRCLLLYSATCSALAPHFQAGSAQPQDTASAATAGALFRRLLSQARSAAQLRALEALLHEIWDSGHAFDAVPQQLSEKLETGLPPLQPPRQDRKPDHKDTSSSIADPGAAGLQPLDPAAPSEQPGNSQDSAPGTPPAEESRWPSTASQPDAADGWDEADQLQPFGEPAVPPENVAHAADGWDLEDAPGLMLGLAQEAMDQPLTASTAENKSEQESSGDTTHAAMQAAGPAAAADGWEADDGLVLPLTSHVDSGSAQAAASAQQSRNSLLDINKPASEASRIGWDGDADLLEILPRPAAVDKAGHRATPGADSDHAGVTHAADASNISAEGTQAAKELSAGSKQQAPGSCFRVERTESSSLGTLNDRPARSKGVPMHACWSALLQRMLAAPDRQLAGCVLARLEKAQTQQTVLVSEAEADVLVTASAQAGEALAVAVGLLLPYAKHQRAAEQRLQQLADLPGPADVSLIATLLARRLWPQAAASPAYPQLAQSLLDHGALATEKERGGIAALAPSAVASLAQAGHEAQAAALAAAHLGPHPAFSGVSNSRALLRPYLAGAARMAAAERAPREGSASGGESEDLSVPEAVSQVWGMLRGQCQEALKHLYAA